MSIRITMNVSNSGVVAKFQSLSEAIGKTILRKAVRQTLKVYQDAAKGTAGSMVTGEMGMLLAKNLIVRARKRRKRGLVAMNVQLKPVAEFFHTAKNGNVSYIPAAIEYGHFGAAPIPFMRTAFVQSKDEMLGTMEDTLKTEIEMAGRK